jgi:hypothetical protein
MRIEVGLNFKVVLFDRSRFKLFTLRFFKQVGEDPIL